MVGTAVGISERPELRPSAKRLSARTVETLKVPGYHADGAVTGLYLQVSPKRSKADAVVSRSWIYRYSSPTSGKRREMGLGSTTLLSLQEARSTATECRRLVHSGRDPIEVRRETQVERKLAQTRNVTFDAAAAACIQDMKVEWSNPKSEAQWQASLQAYASPELGAMPVSGIRTDDILRVLKPIWSTKTETATRIRQRVEKVLDWAKAMGYRTGENPAKLENGLGKLLPSASKLKRQRLRRQPAVPFAEARAFLNDLQQKSGIAALALEFLVLTAARTAEVTGASWREFDLDASRWVIPGERMKARKEHRIPLSPRAVQILKLMQSTHCTQPDSHVFPGQSRKRADDGSVGLSSAALLAVMKSIA